MRKIAFLTVLAIAVLGLTAGTASAQNPFTNDIHVSDPDVLFSITGTASFDVRHKDTDQSNLVRAECDIEAEAGVAADGEVQVWSWEPSGGQGIVGGPNDCSDLYNDRGFNDCGQAGFEGGIVPPGHPYAVGQGFSVFLVTCFTTWGTTGPDEPGVVQLELNGDATEWTGDERIIAEYDADHWLYGEFDLTSDTSFDISEVEN